MLEQEKMIRRVRELAQQDQRMIAALMYGSFTKDEGDEFSDIEFYVYVDETRFRDVDHLKWLANVAPVLMHYVNEHGIDIVIFNNLVRGEFHFEPVSKMSAIRSWVKEDGWPEAARMFVKDNTGELTSHLEYIAGPGPNRMTEENVAFLWNSFLNWFVFGINLLKRGEYIRSQVILFILQGYLLWLARVQENSTTHWLTPSKNAEKDLSAATLARYKECTASVEPKELEQAYIVAFNWGIEAARDLSTKYRLDLHDKLIQIINDRLLRIQQHLV